ncbi:MAG: zf-HC2 domain-containing protein, partial [Planctomycetota bacterium]|nr:zf-HC2 domain-containing protein [Planctomycetota bacterium]
MACEKRFEEMLQSYVDEELGEEEIAELEMHIRGCVSCAKDFQEMYRINHIIQKAFEGLGTGCGLTASVLMSITDTSPKQRETAVMEAKQRREEEEKEAR